MESHYRKHVIESFSADDEHWMRRALHLAAHTVGLASPNPQVGCVLLRDGLLLGEGAHLYDRFDHAEIVALKHAQAAGRSVSGATAFVTLEPCSHHGRTGPCADALIAAGIARCVVATADPNPQVGGRGLAKLRAAGIQVDCGLFQHEARTLNNAFAFSVVHNRPFLTLKSGLSVDGRLAPAVALRQATEPFFLTSPASRQEVQRMRHASDAILTGIGTVLADDPLLTDRSGLPRRRPLMRVILDSELRTPLDSRLVTTCNDDLWLFCAPQCSMDRTDTLLDRGAHVIPVAQTETGLDTAEVLAHLHRAKILSVLLEAGSALNAAFLRADLVDRVVLFYAQAELGHNSIPFAEDFTSSFALEQRLRRLEKRPSGEDVRVSGLLHDPWAGLASSQPSAII